MRKSNFDHVRGKFYYYWEGKINIKAKLQRTLL